MPVDSKTEAKPAERSSSAVREALLLDMACILHDIAPPDAQRRISKLMDEWQAACQREEYERYDI